MNTYFSRFLHITSSYSDLPRISRWNKFANYFDLDHRVKPDGDRKGTNASFKPDGDSVCVGRSMVEMLGVLAIIGVLSVGAIAGYSKAMFKYKLNKHTEQMNTLINAVARNVHSFDNLKQDGTYLTPYFIKMGEIPTEMVKANDNNFVYDIFGQQWQIFTGNSGTPDDNDSYIYLQSIHLDGSSFLSSNSPDSLAICQNIFTIAKENSNNISSVRIETANSDYDKGSDYWIMGDKLCNNTVRCLKNLTLNDIYTICAEYDKGDVGMFQLAWSRR